MNLLRRFIRSIILETKKTNGQDEEGDDLLLEPDVPDDDLEDASEISAISMGGGSMQSRGTITGVTTPLGTGPTYPAGRKKRKKKTVKQGSQDWYKLKTK